MAAPADISADVQAAMIQTPLSAADWLVIAPVAVPILAGAILLMLRKRVPVQAALGNLTLALLVGLTGLLLVYTIIDGTHTMTMGRWLPPFGISFSADLTGALLAFTASIVALVCGIYAAIDIDVSRLRYGFFPFLLLMMAGVNGAFLTGDVFNLYVWFEVLLIASFGLIVLGSERAQLDGAIKYAFLNFIGTTFFLIATGYLYGTLGTLNMADVTRQAGDWPPGAPVVAIATLYLVAFGMKAAAFPLNFWLPASYHTPRIVVSALFAGLLTKVGVYSLLRIMVMMFADQRTELASWIGIMAAATMLFGALGALAQSDIRRVLGFLVVSGIGSMLAGIALAGNLGLTGTIVYAVHSMIVMSGLYLAIGIVGRNAGTFEMRELGGHYAASPWLATGFLLLAFAVAGLPPLSGFWPKLILVKGAIADGVWWLAATLLVTGLLTTLAIFRIWAFAFWRGGAEGVRDGAENWKLEAITGKPGAFAFSALGTLVVITVIIGLWPEPLTSVSLDAAVGLSSPEAYVRSVFGDGQ